MATRRPLSWIRRTSCSLSCGSTSATALLMPSSLRIASAVFRLSPVSITTSRPIPRKRLTASRLVGFTTSAAAITPSKRFPSAKKSGVFPASASSPAACSIFPGATFCSRRNARFPARHFLPSTTAVTPRPETAWNDSASGGVIFSSPASARTASASGCSEGFSSAAAVRRSSSRLTPSEGSTSVTRGVPSVMVPVLSSTTVCTACAVSSASPDLIRIPSAAPRPVPTMMATGVARPSAHGQEITSTEIPMFSANSKVCPASSHTTAEITAMAITTGTKTPLTRSARRAIGAFEEPASSTSRIICARVVSFPTFSARNLKKPFLLMVAAVT